MVSSHVPGTHAVISMASWADLVHRGKTITRRGNDPTLSPASGRRRRGRVLLDEVLPLQLDPKLRRDRRPHGCHIGDYLRLGMRTDEQRRGAGRRRRELKRSGSQIGANCAATARSLSRFSMYWRGMFQDVLP